MTSMDKRCPRCGSEERETSNFDSRQETYSSFGKTGTYYIHTIKYRCNDCRLIYEQEEIK